MMQAEESCNKYTEAREHTFMFGGQDVKFGKIGWKSLNVWITKLGFLQDWWEKDSESAVAL